MSSQFTPPAAHPVSFTFTETQGSCTLWCNYRLHHGGDQTLYANTGFSGLSNDPTGLIGHVITMANLADSGVICITLKSHSVMLSSSPAVKPDKANEILTQAILRAGLGPVTVK